MKLLVVLLSLGLAYAGVYDDPQTLKNRQTMVHLFEWKWTDIAKECENFLQYYGYGAVQVSPPMEHITMEKNGDRPWWIRYQPVSYKLVSRSGNRDQFIDMVQRCNKVGVRIIVDAVLNHMTGEGQKYGSNGVGDTMNSNFNAYDHQESFPGVPYGASDFHDSACDHDINNWNNAWEVRMCRLVNLADLDQSKSNVRQAIAGYLNDLFNIGVAGVRVDAAKSIYPSDLAAIYGMTQNLKNDVFGNGARTFVVGEIPDGGAVHASEYFGVGRVTNFDFGNKVAQAATRGNNFKSFGTFGPSWFNGLADNDALNFIDNHDTQRHGIPLTYKNGNQYKMAVGFMLAWNYGYPRVMSSYYFSSSDQGPPSSGSPNYYTSNPSFNQDGTCKSGSGWVCEHRWPEIRNMALFRSVTSGQQVANVQTTDNGIAFSRGSAGFFIVNNGYNTWSTKFQTGLPAGTYCDVINLNGGKPCSGSKVSVDGQGYAQISVPQSKMFAIHIGGGGPTPTGGPTSRTSATDKPQTTVIVPTGPPPTGMQSTVIFLYKQTKVGQDVFIRGGIGLESPFGSSKNCPNNDLSLSTNKCAMRIQHTTKVPSSFTSYKDWSQGDLYLDWYGAEPGEGTYEGITSQGTPLAWSTNDPNTLGYQPLNKYGANYWIVSLYMDCTNTDNGWFEFKGYEMGGQGWESNVSQGRCSGSGGGSPPYKSNNHFAKCGYVNVFRWEDSSCTITSS